MLKSERKVVLSENKSRQGGGSPGELILSKECVIVYDNGNYGAKCFIYTVRKFLLRLKLPQRQKPFNIQ